MRRLERHRRTFAASAAYLQASWQAQPFPYMPVSFYAEDERLQRIWTDDRALTETVAGLPPGDVDPLNSWWRDRDTPSTQALRPLRIVFAKVSNRPDPAIFSGDPIAILPSAARARFRCPQRTCMATPS